MYGDKTSVKMETLTGSLVKFNDTLRYLDSLIVQCNSNVHERDTANLDEHTLYLGEKTVFGHDNYALSNDSVVNEIFIEDVLNDHVDINDENVETKHTLSKAHLEPLVHLNAYKWKKLNLMTGKNICPWPENINTDDNTAETKLQPETHSITVLTSSFQHLEALLLECEGNLDTLHQRAEGVTSADPKAASPVELSTLQAYWLELYTQVRFKVQSCESMGQNVIEITKLIRQLRNT